MPLRNLAEMSATPGSLRRCLAGCSLVVLAQALLLPVAAAQQPARPSQREHIRIYRAVMDPKNVSDVFGRRIAKRYVVIQVTIANKNPDFQYLVHDVSLDLSKVYSGPAASALRAQQKYELSSEELSILRGVAERGQAQSPRNFVLRALRTVGTVAAGLAGIQMFDDLYAPSVAVFNGPFLTAYMDFLPDFTINQLIRLQDSAYLTNTVIPKQQAKVFAVFLPQAIFMTKDHRKKFWKEPSSLWAEIDFRAVEVLVDGSFVVEIQEPAPPAPPGT
jgi:hypothetical protein